MRCSPKRPLQVFDLSVVTVAPSAGGALAAALCSRVREVETEAGVWRLLQELRAHSRDVPAAVYAEVAAS